MHTPLPKAPGLSLLPAIGALCCRLRSGVQLGGLVLEKPLLISEVREDEIVVRTLGFYAAYAKSPDAPQLILRRRTDTDDHELLARSWQAANDKARELGWIV